MLVLGIFQELVFFFIEFSDHYFIAMHLYNKPIEHDIIYSFLYIQSLKLEYFCECYIFDFKIFAFNGECKCHD